MEEDGSVGGMVPASHSIPPFPGTVSNPLTKEELEQKYNFSRRYKELTKLESPVRDEAVLR